MPSAITRDGHGDCGHSENVTSDVIIYSHQAHIDLVDGKGVHIFCFTWVNDFNTRRQVEQE